MDVGYRKCMRCKGMKNIFQVGNCYSLINTGGKPVKCPMCLGEGKIKTLEKFLDASDEVFDKVNEAKEIVDEAICNAQEACTKTAEDDYNQMAADIERQKTKSVLKGGSSAAKKESRTKKDT